MEFKEYSIDEIGEVVGGGTPSTKIEDYYNGDISWITPKDLSGYNKMYISKGARNITELGLSKSSAKLLPKDSVLLTSRAPIGYVALAGKELCTNQGFKSIVCNREYILPGYLYYYLKKSKDLLESIATGSTFKEVSGKAVKNFQIKIPDVKSQRIILEILSNIDKKIENNTEIICNLEQISQTLFKRWFIDFEFPNEEGQPYKSSGGKMVDSELGEIPEGWEVKYLKDILSKFSTGLNPRKNFVLGKGENYYVTIKNMGDNNVILDNKCDKVDDEAIKIINKRSDLKQKDVLFSGIGTIGRVYLIPEEPNNWNISESIFTLRAVNENDQLFLYNLLLSNELQEYAKQLSSGSVQKGIRKRDLEKYKFPYSGQINQKYQLLIEKLQNQIEITRIENKNLEQLRDTLLPKLLSGEIEIPDDLEV